VIQIFKCICIISVVTLRNAYDLASKVNNCYRFQRSSLASRIVILVFKCSPCYSLIVYNEGKIRETSILPTQVLELSS
jgi:hypothetical protein